MDERGRQGRRAARALIALAVLYGFVALIVWMAQPGFMEPMFNALPRWVAALPILGPASYFLGLAWMIQIYRAGPEPGERTWRYRDL